jgi:hypothetical protein
MKNDQSKKIKEACEQIYGHSLSQAELEEITNNLIGFFELLAQFNMDDAGKEKSQEHGKPS